MRKFLILSVATLSALASCGSKAVVSTPKTATDSLSVAMGAYLAMGYTEMVSEGDCDVDMVIAALRASVDGQEVMTREQMGAILTNYFQNIKPAKAKAESQAFVDAAEKNGGTKTASGLVYVLDEAGDSSMMPSIGDTVKVHYKGTLPDGSTFDSSYDRGEPVDFPLVDGGLIPAWIEGMQLVGKGGKIVLYVPSDLAYGERGAQGAIGPNQALKFEIELLDVTKAVEK